MDAGSVFSLFAFGGKFPRGIDFIVEVPYNRNVSILGDIVSLELPPGLKICTAITGGERENK